MANSYRRQDARKKFLKKRSAEVSKYHSHRKQNAVGKQLGDLPLGKMKSFVPGSNGQDIQSQGNTDDDFGNLRDSGLAPHFVCNDPFASNGDPAYGAKLTADEGCWPQQISGYPYFIFCGQMPGKSCEGDGKWNMVQTGYHDGYHYGCGHSDFWYGCSDGGVCNSDYCQNGMSSYHSHYRPETLHYWGGGNSQWGDMDDWGERIRGNGVHESDWNMMWAQGYFIPKPSPLYPSGSIRTHKFCFVSDDGVYLDILDPPGLDDSPDLEYVNKWSCYRGTVDDDYDPQIENPPYGGLLQMYRASSDFNYPNPEMGIRNIVKGSCTGWCADPDDGSISAPFNGEDAPHHIMREFFPTEEGHATHWINQYYPPGEEPAAGNPWFESCTPIGSSGNPVTCQDPWPQGNGYLHANHAHGDSFVANRWGTCYINLKVGKMYKIRVRHHNEAGQKYLKIKYSHADMGPDFYRLYSDYLGNNNPIAYFCGHSEDSDAWFDLTPSKYEFRCCQQPGGMVADNPGELGMIVGDEPEGGSVVQCAGHNIEHLRESLTPNESAPPNWNIYWNGMTGDLGAYREDTDTTCYCNNDLCAEWISPSAGQTDRSGR